MPHSFRFAVYAHQTGSRKEWEELARRAEGLGYDSLFMPDHFVNQMTPAPALAAAAAATTTLRIACVVFANDFRHPALLAKEGATLDLLSDGRFMLGLGAGWLQTEYEQAGIRFDPAGVRLDRMEEALAIIKGLWAGGPFSFQGTHYRLAGLAGTPKPVQQPRPPIFIGGNRRRLLSMAGREADVVGVQPKTLPRGGHDWAGNTNEALDERIGWIREAAGERIPAIEISNVAYRIAITDRPRDEAAKIAPEYGLTPEQFLASPDFLVGSIEAIVEQIEERRERFGISYLEIFAGDAERFAPIVARLAGR